MNHDYLYKMIKLGKICVNKKSIALHRFWKAVDKDGPICLSLGTNCWLWTGMTRDGYGRIGIDKKKVGAHRYSYEIHVGEIPSDLCALHKCDTPLCVNPDHMFIGDRELNIADCISKDRHAKGEAKATSKLTEEQVLFIRRTYVPRHRKYGGRALAREYKISHEQMYAILNGTQWKYLIGREK